MFVFALIVSVIFNYTLDLKPTQVQDVAAGLMWIVFAFAGVIGLNRIFVSETDAGTLHALLVAPIRKMIKTKQLVIVPHGMLHYLPFHALEHIGVAAGFEEAAD